MKILNCSAVIALAAAGLTVTQPAAASPLAVSAQALTDSNAMLGGLPLASWNGPRSQQQQQQQQQVQQQQQGQVPDGAVQFVYSIGDAGFDV